MLVGSLSNPSFKDRLDEFRGHVFVESLSNPSFKDRMDECECGGHIRSRVFVESLTNPSFMNHHRAHTLILAI